MKSVLVAAKDLKIGGIEKSLIELSNYLEENGYIVTLVLENKEGVLQKQLNKKINIIQYKQNTSNFKIYRKIINFAKKINFVIKYMNKFDISISYATYLKSSSFIARVASKNSILWCHADYLSLFNNDKNRMEDFFEDICYYKFKKIVFVSKIGKENFLKVFPKQKNVYFCNNLINSKKIYENANEKIDLKYNQETITFLNVGRHDEKQKKLSRIIKSSAILKKQKYKFRVIFVGSGPDTAKYKNMVKKYQLEKNIIFVGQKENPYPYYKISKCVILSSDYEGYPVVFLESYILNKPIITTKVSDYEDIKNKRGIVAEKNTKSIYNAMKLFIKDGYTIKENFDVTKYNFEIRNKLKEILKNS